MRMRLVAVTIVLPFLSIFAVGAHSQPSTGEEVLQHFEGTGSFTSRPFQVDPAWELRWRNAGAMLLIELLDAGSDKSIDTYTATQGGHSSAYEPRAGRYYLKVVGVGAWSVDVVRLPSPGWSPQAQGRPPTTGANAAPAASPIAPARPSHDFTEADLPAIVEASQTNDLRFDRDYKGRTIFLRGTFSELQKVFFDYHAIISTPYGDVACFVEDEKQLRAITDWRRGRAMTMQGKVLSTTLGRLLLDSDCSIADEENSTYAAPSSSAVPLPTQSSIAPPRPLAPAAPPTPAPNVESAPSQAAEPPPPMLTPPPSRPLPPIQPSLRVRATQFVHDYFAAWSSDNATAMRYLSTVYAPQVALYGESLTSAAVLDRKRAFAVRWPTRSYSVMDDTLETDCVTVILSCEVKATIAWEAQSNERDARSSGTAEIRFTVNFADGDTQIIKESGSTHAAPVTYPPGVTSTTMEPAPRSFAYQQGYNDRRRWELWVESQSGDYHAGAVFWSGQRSVAHPIPCSRASSEESQAGCEAARAMLAPFDARRRSEPEYRAGWNSY